MTFVGVKHKAVEVLSKLGLLSKRNNCLEANFCGRPLSSVKFEKAYLNVSSTNNVIELLIEGRKWYLRFCDFHVAHKDLLGTIVYKYENLTNQKIPDNIKMLLNRCSLKFEAMGYLDDFHSPVYCFFRTGDPSILGLKSHVEEDYFKSEQFKGFIHYAWSEFVTYRRNASGGKWQCFNYNRCRSQELLYSLFGVERLICKTIPVKIKICNYLCYGYLMKEADGVNPISVGKISKLDFGSKNFRKDLNTLNIMDSLCYERDHRPGNYNVVLDENNTAITIQAFDNDSDFAFFPTTSINKTFVNSSSIVDKQGALNRKELDEFFLERFLSVSNEQIISLVKPYLNKIQVKCLAVRFEKLKNVIRRTKEFRNIQKENEKDYYSVLMHWNELDKDIVLLEQGKFKKIEIDINNLELWKCTSLENGKTNSY